MSKHASDSSEQGVAESYMLTALSRLLMLRLDPKSGNGSIQATLRPDGVDLKNRVIIEAYAHIGNLHGAQTHKVRADLLKLLLLERKFGGTWRKILCFADDSVAKTTRGNSWLAEAIREFNIEVHVIELPAEIAERVLHAQHRQRMENAK